MKFFLKQFNRPPGFGVRQPSGAFRDVKSGGGLPQFKTLLRSSESNRQ
jgi:hypothetical protein